MLIVAVFLGYVMWFVTYFDFFSLSIIVATSGLSNIVAIF